MKTAAAFGALFAVVLVARFCHHDVLWVEEAYPIAAALEILRGKVIYRDFWFDKPPLFAWFYAWFDGAIGWKLRFYDALVVFASSVSAFWLARRLWSAREGLIAAALLAFFLTFGIPAAVMAAAPDQLMIVPHLLAIFFCVKDKPLPAGIAAGVALWLNPKAPFVLAACLLWQWRRTHWLALGVIIVSLPMTAWLYWNGAWQPYIAQVWTWGLTYSRDTFFDHPFREGVLRTANWAGFHATVVIGAAFLLYRERNSSNRRLAVWALISLAAVAAGWRFFPRYYFQLLTPMVILASRGLSRLERPHIAAMLLLLIPFVRFGPRYVQLANGTPLRDLALHDDARNAARVLSQRNAQSLLVWGYRPEVYAYSRVPAGTPWLDSQPLTGVIADRHLTSSEATFPELARANRNKLAAFDPEFIVDGLGPLNPKLAIASYPDLAHWLARYQEVMRFRSIIIYALKPR
jgi:4-amino-4-deoxy-L-arabinose transferase-like glycosyltransferase